MHNYGKRLRAARIEKGMTQVEAAELLGIPQSNYQRIESGKLDIKLSTIANICNKLDISADWLIGIEPKGVIKTDIARAVKKEKMERTKGRAIK